MGSRIIDVCSKVFRAGRNLKCLNREKQFPVTCALYLNEKLHARKNFSKMKGDQKPQDHTTESAGKVKGESVSCSTVIRESKNSITSKTLGFIPYIKLLSASVLLKVEVEKNFCMESFRKDAELAIMILMEKFLESDFTTTTKDLVTSEVMQDLIDMRRQNNESISKLAPDLQPKYEVKILNSRCTKISVKKEEQVLSSSGHEVFAEMEGYHRDLFLLIETDVDLELQSRYLDQNENLRAEFINKTTRSFRFARQLPKLYKFHQALDDLESPWVIVKILPVKSFL